MCFWLYQKLKHSWNVTCSLMTLHDIPQPLRTCLSLGLDHRVSSIISEDSQECPHLRFYHLVPPVLLVFQSPSSLTLLPSSEAPSSITISSILSSLTFLLFSFICAIPLTPTPNNNLPAPVWLGGNWKTRYNIKFYIQQIQIQILSLLFHLQ